MKASGALGRQVGSYIRKGYSIAEACEASGIDRSSGFNWLKGTSPEEQEFTAAVRSAQQERKVKKQ